MYLRKPLSLSTPLMTLTMKTSLMVRYRSRFLCKLDMKSLTTYHTVIQNMAAYKNKHFLILTFSSF